MINLRLGLIVLVMNLLACGAAQNKTISKETTPNIVLIVVDDLGWKDVGYMGNQIYETPNIDALAEGGMYFTDAYAAAAVCSPTRAAIMTGKAPARLRPERAHNRAAPVPARLPRHAK